MFMENDSTFYIFLKDMKKAVKKNHVKIDHILSSSFLASLLSPKV